MKNVLESMDGSVPCLLCLSVCVRLGQIVCGRFAVISGRWQVFHLSPYPPLAVQSAPITTIKPGG